uniref:Inorganic pyrophosphatase n=1 Tax=Candidatus Aschnera chinzeii TaxID=1485666 RepID=A0AAT9G4A6_9ENTR|nr:MAG: inorganic diphosphatase [Candidatus Aschnera chinzeii]
MNMNQIEAGKNIPDDINVIIEISAYSSPIKYEINKESGVVHVDRFISTAMFYPCNYGYINNTLSMDGDPIDALVITPYPLQSNSVIRSRPIGMLKMTDEAGDDIKIIAVPHYKLTNEYDNIQNIHDISNVLLNKIKHFFTHYKTLEDHKWSIVHNWENVDVAKSEIISSYKRSRKHNNS